MNGKPLQTTLVPVEARAVNASVAMSGVGLLARWFTGYLVIRRFFYNLDVMRVTFNQGGAAYTYE